MKRIVSFIDREQLVFERRDHSTVTAILGMKDMIMQAMSKHASKMQASKGDVTLMVLADFSRAFDNIICKTLIHKMHALRFSKCFLKW